MKIGLSILLAVCLPFAPSARAQSEPPAKLVGYITLPDLEGWMDHLAVDVKTQRLCVPAEQKKAMEIVDLRAGKVIHPITGFDGDFAAGSDGKSEWLLHCYGSVGAGRDNAPDSGSGVELYAVIGQAPFVDMLNTMSDATHPLVPLTRPVWGDPLSDPAAYDYIASYSPYENVRSQSYPAVLATTAIGDDRVGFWEPAKWIATLRRHSTSGRPVLLHTETSGGHQGASGRFDELAQLARMRSARESRLLPSARLAATSVFMMRILQIVGFHRLWPMHASIADAIKEFDE